MSVTQVTPPDASLGIGELSRRAGVPVRTVRFYCDEGLLSPVRSGGGHRRFGPDAVERLRTVRRLRALGMGLPAIRSVLAGEDDLGEAIARERAAVDAELAALAWRSAALRAAEAANPAGRAARLDLLAAVADGPAAHCVLTEFWRSLAVALDPGPYLDSFLAMAAPPPPSEPTPDQVVAYAGLVELAGDRTLRARLRARSVANTAKVKDEPTLLNGLVEACARTEPLILSGAPPRPGPELDLFVAAHAAGRSERDPPGFRDRLVEDLRGDQEPRMVRYWTLTEAVTGGPHVISRAHRWLFQALDLDARPVPEAWPVPEVWPVSEGPVERS
ncbi:MerR family transcriptional regulator [Actinomadura rupiterrae]|uniref:MerR family transcriptional regulator n=1 Tax=Actinomadura rupiterrae TaxID=559627 RepID=UPI0020A4D3BE|nr:MerR family transcriptional regulator [Actinomadura rupiterrae]MCP2339384.1 DNA-binding transcriptional MerR regulator [Actinomadura rupiterrae]